jgi:hypothetical protein
LAQGVAGNETAALGCRFACRAGLCANCTFAGLPLYLAD